MRKFCFSFWIWLFLSSSSAAADRVSVHPEWGQVFGEGPPDFRRLSHRRPLSENRLQPQNRDPHQDRCLLQDRCHTIHPGQQQQPPTQERWSYECFCSSVPVIHAQEAVWFRPAKSKKETNFKPPNLRDLGSELDIWDTFFYIYVCYLTKSYAHLNFTPVCDWLNMSFLNHRRCHNTLHTKPDCRNLLPFGS